MSIKERKKRERRARQQTILNAGVRVFAKHGYHNASIELIAEEAELGKATLYYYYKSKEELLIAILAEGIHGFFTKLEDSLQTLESPLDKIRAIISESAAFFNAHPDYFRLYQYLNTHPTFSERIYQQLHPVIVSKFHLFRETFSAAKEQGFIQDIPLNQLISIFGSLVMSMGIFRNKDLSGKDLMEQSKWIEYIFLNGILREGKKLKNNK